MADPNYSGRVTVPVLWDRERRTIVNNESAEIIRMFNSSFDAYATQKADFHRPIFTRGSMRSTRAFMRR